MEQQQHKKEPQQETPQQETPQLENPQQENPQLEEPKEEYKEEESQEEKSQEEESQEENPQLEEPKKEESQEEHLQKEYTEASIAEQQSRIQLLMEDKAICSVRQTTEEEQNAKYEKKIQLKTPLVDYEWQLSQTIQSIPHTELYFSTMIEPPTTTEIGSITEDNIENCTKKIQTKTDRSQTELVTTTYKNRQAIPLFEYISQQKSNYSEYTFMTILDTFQQLLYAIQKLQGHKNPIIIFDIQPESIVYDLLHNTPFFIDHRLAIQIDDLKDKQNCKKLIPHYDLPYPLIPIEIWLLSNIVEVEEEFNPEKLKQWINEYSSQTPNTNQEFIEEYISTLQPFQTWDQLQEELIKTATTWDIYILAMNYKQLCSELQLDTLRVNLDENTPKYPFLEAWYSILDEIIITIPNKRPTIQQIIEKINTIAIADRELYQTFLLEFLE